MLNARQWLSRDDGANAVEYALIVAGIAAVVVIVVVAFGGFVYDAFSSDCTAISDQTSANINVGASCT